MKIVEFDLMGGLLYIGLIKFISESAFLGFYETKIIHIFKHCKMKKTGFIGIDVDSLYHYFPGRHLRERTGSNVIYEQALPRFLELLGRLNLKGTFFLVGSDALNSANKRMVREISDSGHEIANHSYTHRRAFSKLPRREKRDEILRSESLLEGIIGKKIVGFRAPAWDINEDTLDILYERGYLYDSSIMPSYFSILLKIVYSIRSLGKVGPGDLLGKWAYGCSPVEPYFPSKGNMARKGNSEVIELPITVVPYFRLPFWATIHIVFGVPFFRASFRLVQNNLSVLNYQCHAIDLLDLERDRVPSTFFRMFGMGVPFEQKYALLNKILLIMKQTFQLRPAKEVAEETKLLIGKSDCSQRGGKGRVETPYASHLSKKKRILHFERDVL